MLNQSSGSVITTTIASVITVTFQAVISATTTSSATASMSDSTRTHELLYRDDTNESWLITWPPGTGLDWHDHGASEAQIRVLHGELVEQIGNETFTHKSGATANRAAHTSHMVVNTSREVAVSLHTYTPPLTVEYGAELEIYIPT